MNDPYLDAVIRLANVERPVECPSSRQWIALERRLACVLSPDLKQLVSTIGNGHFGELALLNPVSSSPYTKMSFENILRYSDGVRSIANRAGLALYPECNGFLWIGISGNSMALLQRLNMPTATGYELAWLELDYERAHRIDTSIPRFLHDLFADEIEDDWAKEVRELVWDPLEKFFTSRKGLQQS